MILVPGLSDFSPPDFLLLLAIISSKLRLRISSAMTRSKIHLIRRQDMSGQAACWGPPTLQLLYNARKLLAELTAELTHSTIASSAYNACLRLLSRAESRQGGLKTSFSVCTPASCDGSSTPRATPVVKMTAASSQAQYAYTALLSTAFPHIWPLPSGSGHRLGFMVHTCATCQREKLLTVGHTTAGGKGFVCETPKTRVYCTTTFELRVRSNLCSPARTVLGAYTVLAS